MYFDLFKTSQFLLLSPCFSAAACLPLPSWKTWNSHYVDYYFEAEYYFELNIILKLSILSKLNI